MNCSRSRKWILVLIVVLLILPVVPVHAQDDIDPLEGMQQIAFLAGSWDVTGQVKINGEWADFTGIATIESTLDDYGLRAEMTGEADNQRIEAIGFWTYETYFKAPAVIWTDTAAVPNILRAFGRESDDPQIIAFSSDPDTAYQVTLTPIDDDTFDQEIASARSLTATYEPVWDLHFSRRTDAPDLFTSAEPLPPPPAETEQFAFWVGDWEGSARVELEDSPLPEGPASASVRWVLGGHALENTYEGPGLFGLTKIWGLTRYNPTSGSWEQIYALAPQTGFSRTWEGRCEGDRCELQGDNFVNIQPDSFQWQHTHGNPEPIWTVDYIRRTS